jgi:Uri superfamily endonuclease
MLKFPDDKVYIGCTLNLKKRIDKYRIYRPKNTQPKLYAHIDYFGKESFSLSILATEENEEKALLLESKFIEEYDSVTNGLNDHNGRGKPLTEEMKKKLSESTKKAMQDPIRREVSLKALKDSNQKRVEKLSKKVICNETGVIYSSFRQACRQIPCDKGSLWRHFKGVYKQWKGKTYRYLEE